MSSRPPSFVSGHAGHFKGRLGEDLRRAHPAALCALAALLLLVSSDLYASRFWVAHPASTAILGALVAVLVSVTVIEVIVDRRSERRWRLLAQYALLELADGAHAAWGVIIAIVHDEGGGDHELAEPARLAQKSSTRPSRRRS